MTGRAAGYCAGFPVPGYMNPMPGRGLSGGGYLPYGAPVAGAPYAYGPGALPYGYGPAGVPYGLAGYGFGMRRGLGFRAGFGRGFWGARGRGMGRGFRAYGRGW